MKKMYVVIRDAVDYPFNPSEITEEEAVNQAFEWWAERSPNIKVIYDEE